MRAIHQLLQQQALKCKGLESIPSAPSLGGPGVPVRKRLHTGSCTVLGSNI